MRLPRESAAFGRIVRWLESHAPRTRAALLPPAPLAELQALASGRELPEGIARLFTSCGGQGPESPAGLLRGYTMMPLRGVDGLETAWPEMLDAVEAGAEWATKDRYPFAKDFGGSYICVDMGSEEGKPGRIIEIGDDETTKLADDMETFLDDIASELEDGALEIDDTLEQVESFEVVFDAARPRAPGDAVTHSVLSQLGIDAKVESVEAHDSRFDEEPPPRYGFYVRMVARNDDVRVASVRLEDDRRRRFGRAGHGSGGGKPGFFIFATSANGPIPAGSRLFVTLQQSRRV